jgi:hypothetical protein
MSFSNSFDISFDGPHGWATARMRARAGAEMPQSARDGLAIAESGLHDRRAN